MHIRILLGASDLNVVCGSVLKIMLFIGGCFVGDLRLTRCKHSGRGDERFACFTGVYHEEFGE